MKSERFERHFSISQSTIYQIRNWLSFIYTFSAEIFFCLKKPETILKNWNNHSFLGVIGNLWLFNRLFGTDLSFSSRLIPVLSGGILRDFAGRFFQCFVIPVTTDSDGTDGSSRVYILCFFSKTPFLYIFFIHFGWGSDAHFVGKFWKFINFCCKAAEERLSSFNWTSRKWWFFFIILFQKVHVVIYAIRWPIL